MSASKANNEEATAPQKRSPRRSGLAQSLGIPALALLTALLVSGVFIVASDQAVYDAFSRGIGEGLFQVWVSIRGAYGALFGGSFGDPFQIWTGAQVLLQSGDAQALQTALGPISESLITAIPYIFAGLAVALGFRCGLFNIGAEGQIFMGAVAAAFLGYAIQGLPVYVHLPLALLGGALVGGLWGAIPGLLKAWRGAHEVITTIMMNYIAFKLSDYLLTGPMKRSGYNPVSPPIEEAAKLPRLFPPLRFHAGFFVALIVAALVFWFLWKTTLGFEIRTVGANPHAARYAGISVTRSFVLAMALSGGLAGLAGANEVLGVNYNMAQSFSSGYGFDSIALALLGKSHPGGVVLASLLWGFLRSGAIRMQSRAHIPVDIVFIVQAMVIIFVAAPEVIRWIYRIRVETEAEEAVFTRGWGG
ncbi:MAG: ABC transporter permease [Chloroflexia bacterium]|nr:ABC transporter permease [Chloroflexia bacterium]